MMRNLSIEQHFIRLANQHTPRMRFAGKTTQDWQRWRDELLPAVKSSLGKMPKRVPLNPEILAEWEDDGLVKQRVVIDVEEGLSATALIFRPANARGKLPAILACHGHGQFGKDAVMGDRGEAQRIPSIEGHNYDYGLQMAKAGFAVIAIDWRGFGERDDRQKPYYTDHVHGRDICNIHFIRASMLGMTLLGMDIHDGSRALDYLCAQDFVNPEKIGVMGLSFGGTMATWMSICDDRVRATDIICYSDRFAAFAMRDANFCGSQFTPGLFDLCDVPDLHGLIAPRPLLVEIGSYDKCFIVDTAMSCFREVEKLYEAAGVRDRLELDLYEGGHKWSGRKSVQFFRRYLSATA